MKSGKKNLLIGITSDFEPAETGRHARYFLKEAYVDYLASAGAIPVIIPFSSHVNISSWSFLDGLILSGSGPDVDPRRYGRERTFWKNTLISDERFALETGLLSLFERLQKPVLGICGGFQTMNIYRGGTLFQDLTTENPTPLEHTSGEHPILLEQSIDWIPRETPPVNTFHHQGVEHLGKNLVPFARCPDGLLEGFSDPSHPFFLGIQWHPERQTEHPLSRLLMTRFLETARDPGDREESVPEASPRYFDPTVSDQS
ncbi:MAG: gamma-glutamyl-gamma-aminobutyrate hydrolase family protein [Leptospirales bacterium]